MFNFEVPGTEVHRGVMIYDNFCPNPQELINIGLQEDRWHADECMTDDTYEGDPMIIGLMPRLELLPLVDYNDAWYFVAKGLKQMGYRYGNEFKVHFQAMEYPQMIRYKQGVGYFTEHIDDMQHLHRLFSAVLYLNTVEEGGETRFIDIDLSIKPVAGRLAIFPANYLYRHEATMPISSDKFCIATFYNLNVK